MSLGTLGKSMKRTRTQLVETETDNIASEFHQRFGMRDGEYVEYQKDTRAGGSVVVLARILYVEDCYYNQGGGWTANIKVVPMLSGGRLGSTRTITIAMGGKERGLRILGYNLSNLRRVVA